MGMPMGRRSRRSRPTRRTGRMPRSSPPAGATPSSPAASDTLALGLLILVTRLAGVDRDRVAKEAARVEKPAQRFAMGVAGEPRLTPPWVMNLRVVPLE